MTETAEKSLQLLVKYTGWWFIYLLWLSFCSVNKKKCIQDKEKLKIGWCSEFKTNKKLNQQTSHCKWSVFHVCCLQLYRFMSLKIKQQDRSHSKLQIFQTAFIAGNDLKILTLLKHFLQTNLFVGKLKYQKCLKESETCN